MISVQCFFVSTQEFSDNVLLYQVTDGTGSKLLTCDLTQSGGIWVDPVTRPGRFLPRVANYVYPVPYLQQHRLQTTHWPMTRPEPTKIVNPWPSSISTSNVQLSNGAKTRYNKKTNSWTLYTKKHRSVTTAETGSLLQQHILIVEAKWRIWGEHIQIVPKAWMEHMRKFGMCTKHHMKKKWSVSQGRYRYSRV